MREDNSPDVYDDEDDDGIERLHPISERTAAEIDELRRFLVSIDRESSPADDDAAADFENWRKDFLETLPSYDDIESAQVADERDRSRSYKHFQIEQSSGGRSYRLNVHIDDRFGSLSDQVLKNTEAMLARVVSVQTACFVRTAKKEGLTWRRSTSKAFPHSLPYSSPPPTTKEGRYSEEAAVIAAAFHFPLSRPKPGIDLFINAFAKKKSGGWTLGSATINLYNDDDKLRIALNRLAYPKFDDDVWASVIGHEIMHNLGWQHPKGSYDISMAIENYQSCIAGRAGRRISETVEY